MSAVVDSYRDDMDVSYAVDFSRDREPVSSKRSRFPEYRRTGSAPARVNGMHCRRNKRWTWGSGRGARLINARSFASSVVFALASVSATVFGVTIDYGTVGNPGNSANGTTGWGALSNSFAISKNETTNAQYVEFLNKVDSTGTNPNGVYNSGMTSDAVGGITFNAGGAVGAKYTVKSGTAPSGFAYATAPVVYTSWFSAARFANWLQNGEQANATSMETGAYTLNNQVSGAAPARNAGAQVFLPSRDEWYKAAYYNSGSASWYTYPTSSDSTPTNTITNLALANAANFQATTSPIAVGSYVNTTSPYGMFDMLGNATEFTDTPSGSQIQVFGGSWASTVAQVTSQWTVTSGATFRNTNAVSSQMGFRVAAVPEPATIALAGVGIVSLAGLDWMKRRKKKPAVSRVIG
jgi:formylglycine-generating enzyme required for sulfatase activity